MGDKGVERERERRGSRVEGGGPDHLDKQV